MFRLIYSFFLFLSISFVAHSQDTIPRSVLFVGNSYTYFWNLPQTVGIMSREKGIPMRTRQSTAGGVNLGEHWRGEKKLKTRALISSRTFDAVVFHDHSLRAIQHPDSLQYYGELIGDLCRESGATPYIYMTWARRWDPYMQDPIREQYTCLADKLDAQLIPVGLAWQRSRELRPDLDLFDPDGSHPSPTGTYLTACVMYGVLTGESPIGLPYRITSEDKDGERIFINIQSQQNATFCQKVAQEVIASVRNK